MDSTPLFQQAQTERNNNQTDQAVTDYQAVRDQALTQDDKLVAADEFAVINKPDYIA